MEKNNYGASEPITLAATGAKILGKIGLKALFKGGSKKLAKEGGKKLFKKSAKVLSDKAMNKASKKVVRQGIRKGKIDKLKYKADVAGMKAKNVTQKGVQKLADKTGNSYEDTMDMVKGKAAQAGAMGVNAIQSRKSNETPADASSFVSSAEQKVTKESGESDVALSGYANPQGPSAYFNKNAGPSMRKGLKYDNVGASLPLQAKSKTTSGDLKTNKPILASLDKKNIMTKDGASASNLSSLNSSNIKTRKKTNAFDYLKGFNANVNIGGFKLNIGQAAQVAGVLGKGAISAGKKFGEYNKKRKVLKNTKASSTTPKNKPVLQASQEEKFSNIAQNNPKTFNYLTKGFKPGGKVSGQDANIFKLNK